MIDSFGKPQSGILEGNLNWMGDYHECLNVNDFGKYCQYEDPRFVNAREDIAPHFILGLCPPKTCSTADIAELMTYGISSIPANVTKFLNITLPNVTEPYIRCHEEAEIDAPAIASM